LRGAALRPSARPVAQVAQLVEQRTENPRVGGSIPPLGTIKINGLAEFPAPGLCSILLRLPPRISMRCSCVHAA
jgi:hypothetical protein